MDNDDRYTRITLRIPKDLHSRLAQSAEDTSKSMNAEILSRLELTYHQDSTAVLPEALQKSLAGLIRQEIEQAIAPFLNEKAQR